MFESKIRSKTGESLKRDHEMWFANIKEKKFIPEPLRKALSVHETEVANEVEFKKQESEIQEDIRDVFRPVTVNKKVQEKMEAEMKSFRFIAKLTIILLVFTLFLFFFTYLMMLRKIITLEGRVDSLTSHLAHLLSHHIHNSTDIRVEEVLEL